MKELEYPFDSEYILKKAKSLKRTLLSDGSTRIVKRIAVLGGSTTHDIIKILELFLLNYGIEPVFYESEYNMYWQDAMFGNEELDSFSPDMIYIHTTGRNISEFPDITDSREVIDAKIESVFSHFTEMWEKLQEKFGCALIQNNFELPDHRLLGNMDGSDMHGRVCYINELNRKIAGYISERDNMYLCDINYLSAVYGLDKWSDPFYWHMYKYAVSMPAIPTLAFNIANIIKSVYGKNKKALALDLDNTLWGGIIGDDGVDNIVIGQETSMGQVYSEFQTYIKSLKSLGVLLTVDSKNEEENALAGLNRPDSVLKPDDFLAIKANWEPKSRNLTEMAEFINIGEDSFVFVDDNPAEREIIRQSNPGVAIPVMDKPEEYIRALDRGGYFEVTGLSADDMKRNEMYIANAVRKKAQSSFADYGEYLKSLEMEAEIAPFADLYMARIAQLTNKSNQFNLTTRRFSQSEIEAMAEDPAYITLYGKLTDKFGDNGVVTVVAGRTEGDILHIELWLMSCRVLKRDMEKAMMDSLMDACRDRNIREVRGYYYPTAKNGMVKDFYAVQGYELISSDEEGNTVWSRDVASYNRQNEYIRVVDNE